VESLFTSQEINKPNQCRDTKHFDLDCSHGLILQVLYRPRWSTCCHWIVRNIRASCECSFSGFLLAWILSGEVMERWNRFSCFCEGVHCSYLFDFPCLTLHFSLGPVARVLEATLQSLSDRPAHFVSINNLELLSSLAST